LSTASRKWGTPALPPAYEEESQQKYGIFIEEIQKGYGILPASISV